MNSDLTRYKVLVGTHNVKSGGVRYGITQLLTYNGYLWEHNDVAVLRLEKQLKFNDQIQPIKFSENPVKEGTDLQVFGFGQPNVSIKMRYNKTWIFSTHKM